MCGRTACVLDKDTICKRCCLNPTSSVGPVIPKWTSFNTKHQYVPSYNIAPGSFTPILTLGTTVRCPSFKAVIQPMRWGLVPSFVRDDSAADFATSNARIESLLVKPSYGSAMRQGKRCVVLAQGFYEWKSVNGRKQPYYIFPSDSKRLLMMAGVFSYHEQKQGGNQPRGSPSPSIRSTTRRRQVHPLIGNARNRSPGPASPDNDNSADPPTPTNDPVE
ncbi:hypothetical protein AHF37_08045 [Paragonimus kellicotti]|nr:hypothetical protein AHF37_08045 [Paragonimus kellicotti]